MNTPKSREGNLFRYTVYLIGYLMAVGVLKLVTRKATLQIWDVILYILITAMVLLFYIYRFNREQRYFQRQFTLPWLGDFGLTISLTLFITATRVLVMYLQTSNYISQYGFQTAYLKNESTSMFWFLILAEGIIMPILQEFLATGFLFNYAFRKSVPAVALTGIFCSGLIFSALSCQFSPALFLINILYGALFAWSYLYTQTLWMPMYLAILSGILMIVMI